MLMNLGGVILLFRYGMPYRVRTNGEVALLVEENNNSEIAVERRYSRLGKLGLILIVVGTVAQIIAATV